MTVSLLDLPVDQRELDARLIEVHRVQRNGGTILHQPGQLAVYVVVNLNECGLGENEFRLRLQDAIIETCHDSRVVVQRDGDDSDVVSGRHGLVCETGIGVDEGVTCFGSVPERQRKTGRGSTVRAWTSRRTHFLTECRASTTIDHGSRSCFADQAYLRECRIP